MLKADDRREINGPCLHAEYARRTQASAINQFFNGQLGATSQVHTPPLPPKFQAKNALFL